MVHRITERLQDISSIDRAQIDRILASGKAVTIQFSKPGYSESLLRSVDALCQELGSRLEVRFYGFYGTGFDASCLGLIPHVEWLSVDCLSRITSIETLFGLKNLKALSLGIFDFEGADVLAQIQSEHLSALWLCETRTSGIDLTPLTRWEQLRVLHIAGHTRGFETLAALKSVRELSLRSLRKKQRIEAVNEMSQLEKLTIILGGRDDVEELRHPNLRELEVIRVLGIHTLGDLARFPALQKIRVEDQIRLEAIDVSPCSRLRQLFVANCKNLRAIGALPHLQHLDELRVSRTAMDLDALIAAGLPSSAKIVALYTGKKSLDVPMRARLDALGYTEFD